MTFADIIGLLGYMALTGAFILCAALIPLSLLLHFRRPAGLEELSVWLAHAQSALLGLAVLSLGLLLQMGAYEYEAVFNAVENAMRPLERLGGLWSGQASSLLFFSFILSAAISLAVRLAEHLKPAYAKTILLALETTLLFFILPDVFFANPFVKLWMLPSGVIQSAVFPAEGAALLVSTDGQGMNPSLRHAAMLLHPPTLYLGLVGFFIPYAFQLAALLQGDDPAGWARPLYPITLAAWLFLTLGMFLGSWWAYTILGWGGYWGWDSVEIAGLVPWLLSFGLLHSMRMQLRGFSYQRWINWLTAAIVILTLFGILVTRSGILESVHAYASGAMGPVLTVLIGLHLAAWLFLTGYRRGQSPAGEKSASRAWEDRILRWFNLCLVVLVMVCLFGQTLPLTSQLFGAPALSFSAADYERWSAPFFLILLILTAFCPLAPLLDAQPERAKREVIVLALLSLPLPVMLLFRYPLGLAAAGGFWAAAFLLLSWLAYFLRAWLLPRLRGGKSAPGARLGVILIHLGLVLLALGVLGVESLSRSYEGQLAPGDTLELEGYAFTAGESSAYISDSGNVVFELPVMVASATGSRALLPAMIHYTKLGTLYARPALAPGWLQDVQVILEDTPEPPNPFFPLRVTFFPLINWIWVGGTLMAIGGLLGLAGRKSELRSTSK